MKKTSENYIKILNKPTTRWISTAFKSSQEVIERQKKYSNPEI